MNDYAAAYVASRAAIIELVGSLSEEELEQISPLTPSWRVRDVVGHLAGAVSDIQAGRFPSGPMDDWTKDQVERNATRPFDELLRDWAASGIEATFDESLSVMLFDQVSHEFDLHYALGVPGNRASAGVRLSAMRAVHFLGGNRALEAQFDGEKMFLEGDGPTIVVRASGFDIMRSATGRRSANQVRALDSSDPEYLVDKINTSPIFRLQDHDIIEP